MLTKSRTRSTAGARWVAIPAGFRGRALLLAALALAPFLALSLYQVGAERQELENAARERTVNAARLIVENQAGQIRRIMDALNGVQILSGLVDPASRPDCGERLREMLDEHPVITAAILASHDGMLQCASLPAADPMAVSVADRDYFRQALHADRPVISEGLVGRVSGKRAIVVARRLGDLRSAPTNVETPKGVIAIGIDLDQLGAQMQSLRLPKEIIASIVDAEGNLLAAHPRVAVAAGAKVPDLDSFRAWVATGAALPARALGLDRRERFVHYERIPGTEARPLFARTGTPAWIVDAEADAWLRNVLVTFAVLLAATLAIVWVWSGKLVVQPLRRLAETADLLDGGDLGARTGLPHRNGEVGRLARALDTLAAHSERATRALRTLSAGNRTLLRERDEQALLDAMCRVAVEVGGYPRALVARAIGDADGTVEIVAWAGIHGAPGANTGISATEGPRGGGPIGRAIRGGQTTIVHDIASDPGMAPWRAVLLERGFASGISIPLRVEDRVDGAFALYAPEPDAFDAREVELLEEMAADLAFGIETIRARRRNETARAEAAKLAAMDPVSGLANRAQALVGLNEQLHLAATEAVPLAVIAAQFPRLEQLANTYGYAAADTAIRSIGVRLRAACPDGTAARVGYAEFSVLCRPADAAAAESRAEEIAKIFEAPIRIEETEFDLRPAIGASLFPGHGDDPDLLLRRAVIAAAEAARADQPYRLYRVGSQAENPERLAIAGELRRTLANGGLALHYQRKVNLSNAAVLSSEALARWTHPVRGAISPGMFVPIAEETGQIRALTYFAIETAVRQQHSWMESGIRLPVAVNLSARNLYDPELVNRVEGLLSTWGVPGELIDFEITEGALVDDPERASGVLRALRELGGRIYIDDFGTGYSSLSYLVKLPVHALKIDRSFVNQMTRSTQSRDVVASIISLAHALSLHVVAEGVETEAEARLLRDLGCDEAQGYLFGRPESADTFAGRLKA